MHEGHLANDVNEMYEDIVQNLELNMPSMPETQEYWRRNTKQCEAIRSNATQCDAMRSNAKQCEATQCEATGSIARQREATRSNAT